jgi:hypothetical protein
MKIYVKYQFSDKKFIVWYKNQEWYCQVINPKWVGEYMLVKNIVAEIIYNDVERILIVELE